MPKKKTWRKISGKRLGERLIKNLISNYLETEPEFESEEEFRTLLNKLVKEEDINTYLKYANVYRFLTTLINYMMAISSSLKKDYNLLRYHISYNTSVYKQINDYNRFPLLLDEKIYNQYIQYVNSFYNENEPIYNSDIARHVFTELFQSLNPNSNVYIPVEVEGKFISLQTLKDEEKTDNLYNFLSLCLSKNNNEINQFLNDLTDDEIRDIIITREEQGEKWELTEPEKITNILNKFEEMKKLSNQENPFLKEKALLKCGLSKKEAQQGANNGVIPFKDEYKPADVFFKEYQAEAGVYKGKFYEEAKKAVKEQETKFLKEQLYNTKVEDVEPVSDYFGIALDYRTLIGIKDILRALSEILKMPEIQFIYNDDLTFDKVSIDFILNDLHRELTLYYRYKPVKDLEKKIATLYPYATNQIIKTDSKKYKTAYQDLKKMMKNLEVFSNGDALFMLLGTIKEGIDIC